MQLFIFRRLDKTCHDVLTNNRMGEGAYWDTRVPDIRAEFHNIREVFKSFWGSNAPT